MQRLTKEQAVIITGYTGIMTCNKFSDFHEEVEKRMGRPVWTHEMGDKVFFNQIKELFREDFLSLIPQEDVMKVRHGCFKDAEVIELKTNFLQILSDDGRCIFEIRKLDGHSIEVDAGDTVKDDDVIYDNKLIIAPKATNLVVITKPEY